MTRDELQLHAVELLEQDKRLICMWATGSGKSNVVLKFLQKHPGFRTLILVPEQNNIQNWYDEFDKFGVLTFGVEIMCYASFHKQEHSNWDFLVFDEMPHVDTEKRKKICQSVSGNYILALGAVVTFEERQTLEQIYGKFKVSQFGLSKAIDNGILPHPMINVLHLTLDYKIPRYKHNGVTRSAEGYYKALNEEVKKATATFNKNASYINKQRMLQAGSARKRFLGMLKDDALEKVCGKLKENGKRFLCFCSSIEQANKLGEEYAFTSKTPTSMRLLERFNKKEINCLYVVGKLIEGQNLNDIECGVIGQLGGTDRITVQSIGRIMRSKNPQIYVLVFDHTKDISFLKTLTNNISDKYIKHYKF